jgi:hypothetical protein
MPHDVVHGTTVINEGAAAEVSIVAIAALAGNFRNRMGAIWIDATNSVTGGVARIKVDLGVAGVNQRTIFRYDYPFVGGESFNLIPYGPIEVDTDIEIFIETPGGGVPGVDIYYRVENDTSVDRARAVFNGVGDVDDVDMIVRSFWMNDDIGSGLYVLGSIHGAIFSGLAGNGIRCAGGGNNSGFYSAGAGTGHGGEFVRGGGAGSKDIDADEIDNILVVTVPLLNLANRYISYVYKWIKDKVVHIVRSR